jgi:hypothetical protein
MAPPASREKWTAPLHDAMVSLIPNYTNRSNYLDLAFGLKVRPHKGFQPCVTIKETAAA